MPVTYVAKYADVRASIKDADLLLFRKRSLISIAGRSQYSHAAMAGWWGDALMCLEMREWKGGRAVSLSSQVFQREPGSIDVYRPKVDPSQAAEALEVMKRKTGSPYNYVGIICAACLHLPIVRLFVEPDTRDDDGRVHDPRAPEFCSEAYANALRQGAGVDPVPNLSDRMTEPADLGRSSTFDYLFTLTP